MTGAFHYPQLGKNINEQVWRERVNIETKNPQYWKKNWQKRSSFGYTFDKANSHLYSNLEKRRKKLKKKKKFSFKLPTTKKEYEALGY